MPINLKNISHGYTKKHVLCLLLAWTGLVVISVAWNIHHIHRETIEKARVETRTIIDLTVAFRKWNAIHGGAYVPITEKLQPNPYLKVPNRDVTTTSGIKLTMVNPAWMTRQIYEVLKGQSPLPTLSKLVSLNYLNPINKPDEWEKRALLAFEKGQREMSELATVDGRPYLRLIMPLITEEGCLKCHQGYKIGDVRGGISIAVPMKPYYEGEAMTRKNIIITHIFLWFAGMASIVAFSKKIRGQQMKLESAVKDWQKTFDSIEDSMVLLDTDNKILRANDATSRLFGISVEEIIGEKCYKLFHKTDACYPGCPHVKTLSSKKTEQMIFESEALNKILEVTTTPIFDEKEEVVKIIHIVKDITDRKKLEEHLMQSQKMESLGLLAGGVAHDFSNFLTAITGYSSLLRQKVQDSAEEIKGYVQQVLNAAEKAQNLTSSLLTFSRKQIIKPSIIHLNEVIKNISGILNRLIGEDIELRLKCSDVEFPVFADPHQIEQVVMNFATNARDAMPAGGILSIETTPVMLDSEYVEAYGAKPGKYMMISISDTGMGIDKKDMAHIFDPFYTTKEKGKGTGLGLSMVYGIIKQHDGFINVYSEKNIGTTFKIYIPVTADMEDIRKEIVDHKPEHDFRGNETILIAEDEESVREFLRDILEAYGYEVFLAVDGEDAIAKYKEHKGHIDMVMLDVVMPKKNGKEVYNFIRGINPRIKTLFISGYTRDILTSKGIYEEGLEFIAKPLEIQVLMAKVRNILNNQPG